MAGTKHRQAVPIDGGLLWRHMSSSAACPRSIQGPEDLKQLAATVAQKIKSECPGVSWKSSHATLGRFDIVDIVEANDLRQIEKAAMIIRAYGHSTTETLEATPWKEFLGTL